MRIVSGFRVSRIEGPPDITQPLRQLLGAPVLELRDELLRQLEIDAILKSESASPSSDLVCRPSAMESPLFQPSGCLPDRHGNGRYKKSVSRARTKLL
jgi:hypothetical protein